MQRRILFVDDEPNLLQGLKRLLRNMRHEWQMEFTTSGADALELMDKDAYDLIITDMRMPGMNGLQLLNEIKERHPNVIRMILSGQADKDLITRSVGITHQYLSKPCDSESLIAAVTRATELRDLLKDEKIRLLVSRMDTLPSLPSLYFEIVGELQSPDASIQKVGEIISKDPAMTARILQLVNSAFFGIRRRITNPVDASSYLGLETIQTLVLSVHAFSQLDSKRLPDLSVEKIWSHSMGVGVFGKTIAGLEKSGKELADDAFTAGLLHDIGMLILGFNLPDEYRQVLSHAEREGCQLSEAENQILGATHADIGAYLLGLWGLPDSVVEAIAFHHRPEEGFQDSFSLLTILYAANALEHELRGKDEVSKSNLQTDYFTHLGMSGNLACWREECRSSLN